MKIGFKLSATPRAPSTKLSDLKFERANNRDDR